jgi:glycosyltransferase involved in cell wall biosynthesis
VWVLTSADSIPSLTAAIAGSEAASRIHLEGIEFGLDDKAFSRLTAAGFHWYYDRWQRRAAARGLELDRQVDFDVVHHVTLSSYWTRAAAAIVDKPLVWGPVGGGVETPWRLIPELGMRGLVEDMGRVLIRRPMGRVGPARRTQQKAGVIFAQNRATAGRLKSRGDVVILSNATVIDIDPVRPSGPRNKDIYLVGRLVPWKAPLLAVRAMRYVREPDCLLRICGDGPERRRLERAARRWGVRDRVSFDGWFSRDVLLERIASAGALIHPALHEEAGLCVAEALAVGTPVVCLDQGGPPAILREWPDTRAVAVEPADAASTARAMAAAVDAFLADPPEVRQTPLPSRTLFEEELLQAYDCAVGTASIPRHRLRPGLREYPRWSRQRDLRIRVRQASARGGASCCRRTNGHSRSEISRRRTARPTGPGLRMAAVGPHPRTGGAYPAARSSGVVVLSFPVGQAAVERAGLGCVRDAPVSGGRRTSR